MSSSSLNSETNGGSTGTAQSGAAEPTKPGFVRSIGLPTSIAINMTQMCGIGPFITIPLMVAAFGGPQAILGWIAGAILAMSDGLVWAELGAAMPGAGGTYLYLREAFQYTTGRLMPFIFSWTAVLFIPLIMSTGVIGLVSYLGYLWPNMSWLEIHLVSLVVVGVVLFALYRRIESIGFLTNILFVIMLLSIGSVIVVSPMAAGRADWRWVISDGPKPDRRRSGCVHWRCAAPLFGAILRASARTIALPLIRSNRIA